MDRFTTSVSTKRSKASRQYCIKSRTDRSCNFTVQSRIKSVSYQNEPHIHQFFNWQQDWRASQEQWRHNPLRRGRKLWYTMWGLKQNIHWPDWTNMSIKSEDHRNAVQHKTVTSSLPQHALITYHTIHLAAMRSVTTISNTILHLMREVIEIE